MVVAFFHVIDTKDEVQRNCRRRDLLFMVTVFRDGHLESVN